MNKYSQPREELELNTFFFHQEFEEDYRIKHVITKTNWGHRLHTHNFYELFFCMSGNMKFLINETVYYLRKNDLILLNSTDVHGIINDTDNLFERYVIEFDPEYITALRDSFDILEIFISPCRPHILHLNTAQSQNFLFQFNKLDSYEHPQNEFALPLYKKLAFTELLLLVNTFADSAAAAAPEKEDPKTERLERILSYINSHITEDLTVNSLAEQFYLSPSYLSSIFKSFTGYTVNSYIINQRISIASRLLKQNFSVQEAAEKSGFNNYAHFIRTFKKYTGYSPKQFAKSNSKL